MPRIYRTQKQVERFLIEEFLQDLGYEVFRPNWNQERPDAVVSIRKDGVNRRIGIEHTDYFNDTTAGQGSPLSPIADFWKLVQASLIRRISHRKHLTSIRARLKLVAPFPPSSNSVEVARDFARETVRLVESLELARGMSVSRTARDLAAYPVLRAHVATVVISRSDFDLAYASRCSWICSNITTGVIGMNLGFLTSSIASKNHKAQTYSNWGSATEKWLLISASGNNLSNHAGHSEQLVNWDDSQLTSLCSSSPFDRIVFWERIRSWYKWLKPSSGIVNYERRRVAR